ncbi:hypothetical protein DPX16_10388 [Anabarilius grahami]|uniref:Uncharacterized protein n=1 Tax=Anabarilius grahami TaxID=495550 RepID=A0A3N0Y4V6_ANAGA|nr:hypothetical protein DPX16_10388 [Anabarilius grahami]
MAASSPSHLLINRSSTTASGSHSRSSHSRAARPPQHHDPPHQRGLSDSMSLLPPGFRHQLLAKISNVVYQVKMGGPQRRMVVLHRLASYQPVVMEHSEENPEEETPQASPMPYAAYSPSPPATVGEG